MRDTCDKGDTMAYVLIENGLSRKKRWLKCKKTKTFGLAPHHHVPGQGSSLRSQPPPSKKANRQGGSAQCTMAMLL